MKENKGKVFYICFYAETHNKDKYITFPSAWNKVDYVVSRILQCGYSVDLLSASRAKKNAKREKFIKSEHEAHYYFSSFSLKGRIGNKVIQYWINLQIIIHVLGNAKKDDVVVVYHSLYYMFAINILKKLFKKKVIIEIEEAYSHTDKVAEHFRKKEDKYLLSQDHFICINELVKDEYALGKPAVIAYGDYRLCPDYQVKNNCDKIKLVYAGVIEQQRKAAFIAVKTMQYLPEIYELHIMGFGSDKNIEALKERIEQINNLCGRECAFYDGHFSGEDYFRRLQSHHIALSTHIYSASDADSSRYMFSSKILSYLSNNLPVVAQRLECLEKSKVGNMLNFYEKADPILIAETIRKIDLKKEYDSRTVVSELDKQFVKDIKGLLNNTTAVEKE